MLENLQKFDEVYFRNVPHWFSHYGQNGMYLQEITDFDSYYFVSGIELNYISLVANDKDVLECMKYDKVTSVFGNNRYYNQYAKHLRY